MKINVNFTVDIDPESWELNYGISASDKKAIRDDVREALKHAMYGHLESIGVTYKVDEKVYR
jgi:hypothetical protein